MTTRDEQLKIDIQKRVNTIYVTRQVLKPVVIRGALFLVMLTTVFFSVSIKNVLLNFYRIPSSTYGTFLTNAFAHTSALVQVTISLMAIILVWFAVDLIRKTKQVSFFQSA